MDFVKGEVIVYPINGTEIGYTTIIELAEPTIDEQYLYATDIRISPDNSKMGVIVYDRYLQVRDISDGSLITQVDINPDYEMPPPEEIIGRWRGNKENLHFSADGQYIAVITWVYGDSEIRIFNTFTGDAISTVAGEMIDFSPVNNVFATGEENGLIKIWQISNGVVSEQQRVTMPIEGYTYAEFVQFSKDGEQLVTGAFNSYPDENRGAHLQIWDLTSSEITHNIKGEIPEHSDGNGWFEVRRNHYHHNHRRYHFDGELFYCTLDSRPTGSGFGTVNGPPGVFTAVSVFPPVGAYTQRWDVETGEKLSDIESKTSGFVVEEFLDFVHSPKNEALYILTSNHHLEVWELDSN